jgi:prolyl-tRNA synthetase
LLPGKNLISDGEGSSMSEQLYQNLLAENLECLYDDREESPGVKFNDADLIGIPIRLTISERSIKSGGVEYKRRDRIEKSIIPIDNIISIIRNEIRLLESDLA